MPHLTDEKEITGLVVIDPYNDFISEGGKIWDRIKNLRVPICKGGLSGCQTGSFNSGKVQAVAEEFHKDYGFGGSCEKLWKRMAEGNGDDLFGGGQSWPNGSNPGAE